MEWTVVNGVRNGSYTAWNSNGQKVYESILQNDQLHGPVRMWWPNGKKMGEGACWHDMKHGKWTSWDKQGNINYIKYYINGKKVTKSQYLTACAKDPTLPKPPEEIKQDSKPEKNPGAPVEKSDGE